MIERRLIQLGIQQEHLDACRLPAAEEPVMLVDAGCDIFDRPIQMTPETARHWVKMQTAAAAEDIELQLVSAFRSVDYQCELFSRKLARGIPLEQILKVNAIPGFSEHHTGRALDVSTPDFTPLETEFEDSAAFAWLQEHAARFDFKMSYPRGNAAGIDYEPWHWTYQGEG